MGICCQCWGVGKSCLLGWKCVLLVLWSALWFCRFRCPAWHLSLSFLSFTWGYFPPPKPAAEQVSWKIERCVTVLTVHIFICSKMVCYKSSWLFTRCPRPWFVCSFWEQNTDTRIYFLLFFACIFLFFLKICVFFLLITSDKWNTICCKMTVCSQTSVHCVLIFLKDRLKLRRKKS